VETMYNYDINLFEKCEGKALFRELDNVYEDYIKRNIHEIS
jgi:hypothetical protein